MVSVMVMVVVMCRVVGVSDCGNSGGDVCVDCVCVVYVSVMMVVVCMGQLCVCMLCGEEMQSVAATM